MSIALLLLGFTSLSYAIPSYDECSPSNTVCEYWLVVEKHVTMVKTKGKVPVYPQNGKLYHYGEDKSEYSYPISPDNIITADGVYRLVVTVNKTIPGPPIVVYKDQKLVIHVFNKLTSESTTIHWHGLHQRGTPFMDGLGYITQCPIGPGQKFTYKFLASQTGTYWYHSHVGLQRSDGVYGALVIKDRPTQDTNYPTDVIMTVGDWHHSSGDEVLIESIYGPMVRGRRILPSHTADGVFFSEVPWVSGLINGRGRYTDPITGKDNGAPLTWFKISEGETYRFRVIQVGAMYPLRISVDNHVINIVSMDGSDVIPFEVESFLIYPGERYDFSVEANQPVGNYWIRAESIEVGLSHSVNAILHYKHADKNEEPSTYRNECTNDEPCRILNCPFNFYPYSSRICIPVTVLRSVCETNSPPPFTADSEEYFLNFAFPDSGGAVQGAVNGKKFVLPGVDALTENDWIGEFDCNRNDCGKDKVCTCTNELKVPFNKTIQMVWMNMGIGSGAAHPIHMHGHSFHVLKLAYAEQDPETGKLYTDQKRNHPDIDCGGGLNLCNEPRWKNESWRDGNATGLNLGNAPMKDTLVIPPGAYAVIRIKSDNPGKWFMHCHIDVHMIGGMAIVLSEAPDRTPKPPHYFPRCNDFYFDNRGQDSVVGVTKIDEENKNKDNKDEKEPDEI